MKNKILFTLLILIVCSCQSNVDDEQALQNFIAIDMEGKYADELSIEEEKLYYEARSRFNTIVEYKNEQFYLISNNSKDINISPSLFEHFKQIMERSNDYYSRLSKVQKEKINISLIRITQPKTKTRTEIPGYGESGFVRTWYGFDVYLSSSDLQKIGLGASAAGIIAMYIPDPSLSKAISLTCGLGGVVAEWAALNNPNGIIVSFVYPVPAPGACLPFNASSRR